MLAQTYSDDDDKDSSPPNGKSLNRPPPMQTFPITIPDQAVREIIRTRLNKSFLVEASAGSGKTHCLIERMVALIREGEASVQQIAAITFTVKAAGELRNRFQNSLELELKKCKSGTAELERLSDALAHLDQAFIGTIHSFCGRLLRERPVEAGIDPEFREGDDLQIELLKGQTWQSYLEDVHLGREILPDDFVRSGLSLFDLQSLYEQLSEYDDVEFERTAMAMPGEALEITLKATLEFMDQANAVMPERPPPGRSWEGLQENLLRANAIRVHLNLAKEADVVRFLEIFETGEVKQFVYGQEGGRRVQIPVWTTREAGKNVQVSVHELRTEHLLPALNAWRTWCYPLVLGAVERAVDRFRIRRRQAGVLSFQDLLMDSVKLLRDSPSYIEVREYFQRRLTHIFVDEFQDTDPIQAEVMFLITADNPAESDWKKATPRQGSLFIVGDPKQSIYRFRRADISIYDLVKEKFAGNVLTLTSTFRIAAGLCDRLNPALQGLIEKHKAPYQAAYTELHPVRPAAVKDPIRYVYHETVQGQMGEHSKNFRVASKDAETIARIISDMKDWSLNLFQDHLEGEIGTRKRIGAKWGDFLILARQKTHLPIYATALEKLGIPYRVSGANAFKSREISPFMNLLTAVADPENSIALVAYLRDALAGISDEALYQFKSAGGSFESLWHLLRKSEELSPEIHSAALRIKAGADYVRRYLPSVAVESLLEDSGLLALTRSQESGGSRAGSLLRIVSLAKRMEREGMSFVEIVARLEDIHQRGTGADYSESLSLHPAQDDAVTLMNLHKAKGLEAPVVFLADPRTLSWHTPRLHVRRAGGRAKGFIKVYGKLADGSEVVLAQPKDWDQLEQIETEYLKAEENRLIYVAATRARDLLVISHYQRSKGSEPHPGAAPDRPWEPLFKRIKEPLRLTIPREPDLDYVNPPENLNRETFQRQAERNRLGLRTQTYAQNTAHSLAADPGTVEGVQFDPGRIGGVAWGTVIHRLLADCAIFNRPSSEVLARKYLAEEGLSGELIQKAVDEVEVVRNSGLWQRLTDSEARYAEVPFAIRLEPGEEAELKVQAAATGIPTLFKGTVDLAFKEKAGWVIVDYKTEATEGRLEQLKEHYRPQISFYGRAWHKLVGQPVHETALYFLDGGHYERLS